MERFYSKVYKDGPDGCHLWTASKTDRGYGGFSLNGKRRRAHRVAWQLAHGPIPEGLCVCHTCDVRACVNVDHLFLGTVADNQRDMIEKGRHSNGDRKGEANGAAKLTEADVLAIRADSRSQRKIAPDYGVGQATIGEIKRRLTWKHI